jgi:hypothetical protein
VDLIRILLMMLSGGNLFFLLRWAQIVTNLKIFLCEQALYNNNCPGMEIDDAGGLDGSGGPVAAGLAAAAAGLAAETGDAGGGSGGGRAATEVNQTTVTTRPDQTKLELGANYTQCSNARRAGITLSVTVISDGNCEHTSGAAPEIGSLDWGGDSSTLKTFHGARVNKNGRWVNECLSASFDPRNLFCVGCDSPHHIISSDKPAVIAFTDQNFVPFMSGGDGNCIAIVRLENASLSELADLAAEILDRIVLPGGSILLFGSGSYLFRVGAAQYAAD